MNESLLRYGGSLLGGVLLSGAGCVASAFSQSAPYSRAARPAEAVEVLKDGVPARPYREVGTIRVRSGLGYRLGLDKVLSEAGRRGCDAIWKLSVSADYQRSSIGDTGERSREDDFRASCLIYLDRLDQAEDADAGGAPPGPFAVPPTETRPFSPGSPE